jgi:glycosyltransferase involved in cell wall biosynthesis
LHAEGLKFEITFVGRMGGNSPYEQQFTVRLREASRLGFARHKMHLSAPALAEEMSQADALIHFPREEAFGLVVTEAISQGMTVFASRVGGLIEVCRNVPQCFLMDSHDLAGLQRVLQQWLLRAPERNAGLNAGDCIKAYHPVTVASSTLAAYTMVTDSPPTTNSTI